jgi:hypothetical protein
MITALNSTLTIVILYENVEKRPPIAKTLSTLSIPTQTYIKTSATSTTSTTSKTIIIDTINAVVTKTTNKCEFSN